MHFQTATADRRHILVPAPKHRLVDTDRIGQRLVPALPAARERAFPQTADRRPTQAQLLADLRDRADLRPTDLQRLEQRPQMNVAPPPTAPATCQRRVRGIERAALTRPATYYTDKNSGPLLRSRVL